MSAFESCGMKLTLFNIFLAGVVFWQVGEIMESDSERPNFPEFVCLSDDDHEVVDSELDVSALDKTLNPEDFSREFRCVRFFVSSQTF